MKEKKNAFTLIELISVLVIMAIIALIVTPLVMSIIRKVRISADKRSIDAYGRSIELAVAGYLLDNGYFPTNVDQLTIEYSGNEVLCTTTQLNSDSSVYLDGCTVDGRSVEYHYGENKSSAPVTPSYTAYQVGDYVSYNGVTYYVIEDSNSTNDTVKLLKENPLTKAEIDSLNLTGITVTETNGYGAVQYGSSVDYSTSTVKQVVDAWKNTIVKSGDTVTARLITLENLTDNLGFILQEECVTGNCYQVWNKTEDTPIWVYNENYYFFTSTKADDSNYVYNVMENGTLLSAGSRGRTGVVRPVLELNKSADITKLN